MVCLIENFNSDMFVGNSMTSMYDFEQLSLKKALKDNKLVFDDEFVKIASDPHANINDAIFEVEFSNFLSGNAHPIYLDPALFFRKTHFTDYMKNILKRVLSRVTSISDESYAIILDTTFGGGKTHTLVTLYHLFKNRDVVLNSQEIRQVLKDLGLDTIPDVEVVAIDGHNVDAEENLWNVIGKMLGDQNLASRASPPTAQEIENAIKGVGKPVIFLLDELVVYISKIMGEGEETNGRIARNKAFIHSLFVATEATKTSIVILTIPESEAYKKESEILRSISAIAERGAAKIAPVAKEDIIRILKKRLVKHIDEKFARMAAKALHELYAAKLGVGEAIREERLFECYPFNPELVEEIFFGRIGTYEDFQRTRGILKIMARVIVNLLRHVDELPESILFISAGEVDLSDPELMRMLTDDIFGKKLDQVVQTDIATSEGTAHAQRADGKPRFGNFVRIATTVYLYSLFPDETKQGANSRVIFKALGDENLDPSTIDAYLERLYDEIATHIFRAEGTDRYYFKAEENPRALVRLAARDVKDEEVKLHLQKQFFAKIIPSTDIIAVNIFEKEIKRDNTDPGKLNVFAVDYEDTFNHFSALKKTKDYESEPDEVAAREVYSRIFSQMLSITTPNRNSIVLLFPIPWEIPSFKNDVKELIACERLKKERSKDREFLKELKVIQKRIYAKAAQKLINIYSFAGFYKKNDQEIRQITPIAYDDKAKYTERIFEELERKWGKVISSASIDYIEGIMGVEKDYIKLSELIYTIANSTSYPFIPVKLLKSSVRELVKSGELAIFRGEICEPEDVNLEKSDEIIRGLKIGVELADLRDTDYVLKKEFAEELLNAAKRKRADEIAGKMIEALGDKKYAEISEIEALLPEYSRKDLIDAAKRSERLELFGGDISLIRKFEDGIELNDSEVEAILNAFGREGDETYVFRMEYAEEIKKELGSVQLPPPPPPPPSEWVKLKELIEKFDKFSGKSVKAISITGKGSNNLKEDSLSITGAVSFLNLTGRIKVDVRGLASFKCNAEIEKAGIVDEILRKIAELDENPVYSIKLETNTEINEDFKVFAEEIGSTDSKKLFKVE